uniref:Thioredoxin peroxidase n=1 Tax=Blastobotrys adeninivorans TaxID=409370 RepID=A0A060T3Q3_BLAAD
MTFSAGQQFPSGVKFVHVPFQAGDDDPAACGIPQPYDCDKELPNKKVVIVAVPGAFTPTCTANHIPPYVSKFKDFKAKGVDDVIVLAANDPFVMAAWGKVLKNQGLIFASDGNASFSKAGGFDLDLTAKGMGERTARYALIVDHGKITYAQKEPGSEVTVSGADAVLAAL